MYPLYSSAVVAFLFGTVALAHPTAQDLSSHGQQIMGDGGILEACVDRRSQPGSTAAQLEEVLQGCINGDLPQSAEDETGSLVRRNIRESYSLPSAAGASSWNQLRSSTSGQINQAGGETLDRSTFGSSPVMKIAQATKSPAVLLKECAFKTMQTRTNTAKANAAMLEAAIRICVDEGGYLKKKTLTAAQITAVRNQLAKTSPRSFGSPVQTMDLRKATQADRDLIAPPRPRGAGSWW
ncbi:MAG: hypothetical protein M1823_001162 [Watsoniomyces obsoletus]|nr:MAG: hypothetical protein M1823_001162 [Watsoniomyces obsoletus]